MKIQGDVNKSIILKPKKRIYIAGFLGLICSLFVFYVATLGTIKDIYDAIIFLGINVPFFTLSMYLILYSIRFRIIVDNEKIAYIGTFGAKKEIPWNEIRKMKINVFYESLKIETENQKIGIDINLVGINELLYIIKERIAPSIYSEVFDILRRIKKLKSI